LDGVILTPLKQILHPKGDIYHAIKKSDDGYSEFGEAYFSTVHKGDKKGWKKHKEMILNIIVPVGMIEFIIYNEEDKEFFTTILSTENYQRLTVKAGLWMAFRGISSVNLLLNIASLEHDPAEAVTLDIEEIRYEW